MLDQRKIKIMTRLALYEETQGKEDFKVSEYYRKDYASMHMIFSVLWITAGFVCLGILIAVAVMDMILSELSTGLVVTLGAGAVLIYLMTVIAYLGITSHIYNEKHKQARQRVKRYNHGLTKLLKTYEKEKR